MVKVTVMIKDEDNDVPDLIIGVGEPAGQLGAAPVLLQQVEPGEEERCEMRCEVRGGARGGEMGRVEEPHLKVRFFRDSSM